MEPRVKGWRGEGEQWKGRDGERAREGMERRREGRDGECIASHWTETSWMDGWMERGGRDGVRD